jgi:hypothetical protein
LGLKFPGWALGATSLIIGAVLCFSNVTRGQQKQSGVAASQVKSGAVVTAAATFEDRGFVGDNACQACHQREFESYRTTRHHLDSALAREETIHGHFDSSHNTMASLDPQVSFRMDFRNGAFFETSLVGELQHEKTRSEKMEIVVASGTKGKPICTGAAMNCLNCRFRIGPAWIAE